ncbi:MAG TPA: glycosyltransferase [Allosphingosinicella sp.]|jgi:glycosyltransferase involved in cell wall biosynthesis
MSGRLRIAFLLPHLRPGGAERVVVNLLRALDRERFEPHLFLGSADGAFLELVPEDVEVVGLGGRRARTLPRRIAQLLDERRIDVAYSATPAMNVVLLASCWWGGRRTRRIVSEHTTPADHLRESKHPFVRRLLMRLLYPSADAIAVPTDAIGVELKRVLGRSLLPVVTLPNPAVEGIQRAGGKRRTGRPIIVSAGRLVEAKGFDVLIDAAAFLAGRGLDFALRIHGEGPLEPALREKVASLGLQERVTLAGYESDLSRAFADADLFVLASRREGFGNVLVEAMAAGLPTLATRCSGPESLIEDGVSGFLVAPEDPAALSEAMAGLLAGEARRNSVVEAGYAAARHFAIGPATRRFEALADRLASNPRRANHPEAGHRPN